MLKFSIVWKRFPNTGLQIPPSSERCPPPPPPNCLVSDLVWRSPIECSLMMFNDSLMMFNDSLVKQFLLQTQTECKQVSFNGIFTLLHVTRVLSYSWEPVLRSAKRAPANIRRLNNRKWRQRYC